MTRLAADLVTARISRASSSAHMARRAAQELAGAVQQGVDERGFASLAVSGGRTPTQTFRELRNAVLDWRRVHLTLVDERWVEPDSPLSNQRLVEEHLLVGAAAGMSFLPMKNAAISPLAGLGRYIRALREFPMPLDAVLLGMGEDGHFASLFPRSSALRFGLDLDAPASCVSVPAGGAGRAPEHDRMSLSLATISLARRIVLLAAGPEKLAVLERAIGQICNPTETPIAALLAFRPDTLVLHAPE